LKQRTARKKNSARSSTIVTAEEKSGVSEQIFGFFKEQLAAGLLKPGDKLLPERELAQRLGVSRPMLREVMRAMALLGVIEIRAGQAAAITSPSVQVLGDFFGMLLSMRPSMYEHILEARIAIECQAVRLACANAERADIQRLEAAIDRIRETAKDDDAGAEADFEFHTLLVTASHNEVLLLLHEEIATLLRRSHHERRRAAIKEPELLDTLGEAHHQLVDAILARDPDAAENVVRQHFYLAQTFRAQKQVTRAQQRTKTLARSERGS
jgi:GntR family transcriptional regulator, transcriptional repressor for pyruvate dehydrogenase complex